MRLYRLVDNGRRLELVHKTAVGGIPGALAAFKGRLLAGVGPIVRLYDLGRKKLLRKSEYRRYAVNYQSMTWDALPANVMQKHDRLLVSLGICTDMIQCIGLKHCSSL